MMIQQVLLYLVSLELFDVDRFSLDALVFFLINYQFLDVYWM